MNTATSNIGTLEHMHENALPFIVIPSRNGYEIIKKDNIIMIKAESNYSNIYLNSDSTRLISSTLKDLTAKLDDGNFMRVHQSYLINLNYLKRIYNGKLMILELHKELKAFVSRSKRKAFLDSIMVPNNHREKNK